MKAHGLVVGDVPPSFAVPREKLGIEAPCHKGINDKIIIAVYINRIRKLEEGTLS